MALCDIRGPDARPKVFDASALATAEVRRATVYRCAACGSEIPFDALMVTCRCVDDEERVSLAHAAPGAVGRTGYTQGS